MFGPWRFIPRPLWPTALALPLILATAPVWAVGWDDPFATSTLTAPSAAGGREDRGPCPAIAPDHPLSLADAVDEALCANPQTHLAWANAKVQAAQVGLARGAYLPTLTASGSLSRTGIESPRAAPATSQSSASLSANYLLYDFGGRAARLESAYRLMDALAATQDATLQQIFLATVQAYYQWFAATTAVDAVVTSERAAQENQAAADTRYRVGTGTPADRLQAQTAAAQATLARIQAEGNARTALGALANALGRDANAAPALLPPADTAPPPSFEGNLADLIAQAKRARPDLRAAEAQVQAAEASIDAARATGRPSISLVASRDHNRGSPSEPGRSNTVGVAVTFPLFTGLATTYGVRQAEAQRDARAAQRDLLDKQVSLDVWRAYYALRTGTEALRASASLLVSAEQNAKVAAGRYRAGVGNILDLLNAQSALASARQQNIQALYTWRVARITLAQAMGALDFSQLPNEH